MRRSGLMLGLAGVAGALFFWATDPRSGWLHEWGGSNVVDAANQAAFGTVVGLCGSAAAVVVGLWLAVRRSK